MAQGRDKGNKEQQLNIALGIIRELLQHITEDSSSDSYRARRRAENFLKAMEEAQ